MKSHQKDPSPKTEKAAKVKASGKLTGGAAGSAAKRRTAAKKTTRPVSKGSTDYILSSAPGPRTLSTERIREIVGKVFREREAAKKTAMEAAIIGSKGKKVTNNVMARTSKRTSDVKTQK